MNTITFTKTAAPEWLLAMWKEIDDKTFGKGFDCFAEDAVCNLGVADWHGREAIRENLQRLSTRDLRLITTWSSTWDSPALKVFHGKVGMKFDDPGIKHVRPTMSHFSTWTRKIPPRSAAGSARLVPQGFNLSGLSKARRGKPHGRGQLSTGIDNTRFDPAPDCE